MHAKQCRSGTSFDPFDDFAVCSVTVVRRVIGTKRTTKQRPCACLMSFVPRRWVLGFAGD